MSYLRHSRRRSVAAFERNLLILWLIVGLATGAALAGCDSPAGSNRPATPFNPGVQTAETDGAQDANFARAMDFQFALDSYEFEPAAAQVSYHLNRWIENQPPQPNWSPDPLVSEIPPRHRSIEPLEELGRLQYKADDVRFVQESMWLRDIGDWCRRGPENETFQQWIDGQGDSLDRRRAEQLLLAERLFDWVVRNIQLDPTLPYPKDEVIAPGVQTGAAAGPRSRLLPPARGENGPGYTLQPWEALLRGHGDSLVRARLFILLARQQHIDAVMIGLYNRANPSLPRPWLPAVVLGDDLYLFDTELGLPLPNAQGEGVVTLAQVLDEPELLTSLDVGDNLKYRTRPDELENLTALIDAAPECLSLRMRLLEARLAGGQQTALTVQASDLAESVRGCRGIGEVRLWTLPYETYMYHVWLEGALRTNEQLRAAYARETVVFANLNPLVQGRYQHFRGAFEVGAPAAGEENLDTDPELEKPGAKSRYMEMRIPDSMVAEIPASPELQERYGLQPQRGEDAGSWQARVMSAVMMFSIAKAHASYWMGLAQYESGNYGAAVDWLKGRTIEATPDGPWTNGARYNLARCYEKLGKYAEARQLYLADDSPQRHGNLLRARRIEAQEKSGEPADSPP